MNRKQVWILFALVAFLISAYVVTLKVFAPQILASRIKNGIETSCDSCHLDLGAVQTSLVSPGTLAVKDIRFVGGDKSTTAVRADIKSLEMKLSLLDLKDRLVHVSELNIVGPYIELMDGPKHSPPKHSPKVVELPVQFVVEKTRVTGGAFRYVSQQPKLGNSRLEFTDIEGESDAIGNTPELLHAQTHSQLSGHNTSLSQAEANPPAPVTDPNKSSKKLFVVISANYLTQPYREDVQFQIHNHTLTPIGEFLTKNDGIKIGGLIRNADVSISLRDRKVKATMVSDYDNLKVTILPTAERSSISAGLMQLGVGLAVRKTTQDKGDSKTGESSIADRHANRDPKSKANGLPAGSITDAQPNSAKKFASIQRADYSRMVNGFDVPAQDNATSAASNSKAAPSDSQERKPIEKVIERNEYETVVHSIIRSLKEVAILSAVESQHK